MDEQQAIDKAVLEASDFLQIAEHGNRDMIFGAGMALAAALEGMALAHEQRLCECGCTYFSHLNNGGGCCACPCTGFEEVEHASVD